MKRFVKLGKSRFYLITAPPKSATSSVLQNHKKVMMPPLNDGKCDHTQLDTLFPSQTKTRDTPSVLHVHKYDTTS
jgi:hypothetical protein